MSAAMLKQIKRLFLTLATKQLQGDPRLIAIYLGRCEV